MDIFVAKFEPNGNWIWAAQAGGLSNDEGKAICVDEANNFYVTGSFKEIATFGSSSVTSEDNSDVFVAKIDLNGNWSWVSHAGGNNQDEGEGIVIDQFSNCFVTGNLMKEVESKRKI